MYNRVLKKMWVLIVASSLLLVSCSDVATSNEEIVTPQKRFKSSNITIDGVKVLLQKVYLKKEKKHHRRRYASVHRVRIEHQVVNFDMSDNGTEVHLSGIRRGTYSQFWMKVKRFNRFTDIEDEDFTDENGRYSMVITGKIGKSAFTFKTSKSFFQRLNFMESVDVNDGNITVGFVADRSGWFIDPDTGNDLDPNDPLNHDQIVDNIKASFRAESEFDATAGGGGGGGEELE